MVSVDSTSSGASSCAFRITSERAQSSDSETDGSFRRSMARIFWTAATTARASRSGISGTLSRMIASSSAGVGKSMNRCRHRRLRPSESSRALLDVSTTSGMCLTVTVRHIPLVVLTSNNARELSDGLKRRCLHLFIDFPTPADELAIIRLKVPEIPERLARAVVAAVQKIRAMDLRKLPSVSESLDWARSLVILNAQELAPELVESTLTMLVKHEKDLERVKGALDKVLAD